MLKPSAGAKDPPLPAPSVGAPSLLASFPLSASEPPSSESHPSSSPLPSSPSKISPRSRPKPAPSIEAEKFAFRFRRAAKLAAAAKIAIKSEAIHIRARIKEEELILSMLRDEEEHTGSRMKTASHQLEVICKGAKFYGLELPGIEEMEREALKSEVLFNVPSSPSTPPRTPPPVFREEIVDAMNQSSGSSTHESSHLRPLSGMSSEHSS